MDGKLFGAALLKFAVGFVLVDGLEGYKEYAEQVKWRLVPRIW